MKIGLNNFVYFSNAELESVKLEKLPLRISTKKLAIRFKGMSGSCPRWVCPSKHKLVPYQEENFKKLLNK